MAAILFKNNKMAAKKQNGRHEPPILPQAKNWMSQITKNDYHTRVTQNTQMLVPYHMPSAGLKQFFIAGSIFFIHYISFCHLENN